MKKILELRKGDSLGDSFVRPRRVPMLNRNATKITNIISWVTNEVCEPSLTCHLTTDEIVQLLDTPMDAPEISCHGQAIERVVKQVTKAAESVYGEEKRDGFVRSSGAQRILVPARNSKRDLVRMTDVQS